MEITRPEVTYKSVAAYAQKFYSDPYGKSHVRRYIETFMFMVPVLKDRTDRITIIDLGSTHKSHLVEMIEYFYGEQICDCYSADLRHPFKPELVAHAPYDLVICTEVIEHINEREDSYRGSFTYHGMIIMLREINKIMFKDSVLVLTTPNVCGWKNVMNICKYTYPFNYKPHVRELAHSDILDLLGKSNLVVDKYQIIDCWPYIGSMKIELDKIKAAMIALGYSDKDREDDMMYLIKKK